MKREALGEITGASLIYGLILRVPQGSPPYSTGASQLQYIEIFRSSSMWDLDEDFKDRTLRTEGAAPEHPGGLVAVP